MEAALERLDRVLPYVQGHGESFIDDVAPFPKGLPRLDDEWRTLHEQRMDRTGASPATVKKLFAAAGGWTGSITKQYAHYAMTQTFGSNYAAFGNDKSARIASGESKAAWRFAAA